MKATIAKFSVDDYHQMVEVGIFARRQVELINGLIVEMPPEGTEHSYYGQTLADILRFCLANQALIRENKPITLTNSEPIPDIAIVHLPASLYRLHHPYPDNILFLVEISKSTFTFDTTEKKETYAIAGIPEYWVVDVKGKKLIVFRSPFNGKYQEMSILQSGSIISPLTFPHVAIAVEPIFT